MPRVGSHTTPVKTKNSIAGRPDKNDAILSVQQQVVFDQLVDECPWIVNTDQVAVAQYCRAEARARILGEEVQKIIEDLASYKKVPVALITAAIRADEVAMKSAEALGLSPQGRMKIMKDAGYASALASQSFSSLTSRGAELRQRR